MDASLGKKGRHHDVKNELLTRSPRMRCTRRTQHGRLAAARMTKRTLASWRVPQHLLSSGGDAPRNLMSSAASS